MSSLPSHRTKTYPALSNLKATAFAQPTPKTRSYLKVLDTPATADSTTRSHLKVFTLQHPPRLDYHHKGPVRADGYRKDLQAGSAPFLPTKRSGHADDSHSVQPRSQVRLNPDCRVKPPTSTSGQKSPRHHPDSPPWARVGAGGLSFYRQDQRITPIQPGRKSPCLHLDSPATKVSAGGLHYLPRHDYHYTGSQSALVATIQPSPTTTHILTQDW